MKKITGLIHHTLALLPGGRITLRKLLGSRLPQYVGFKDDPSSAKTETETKAWRLKPDRVERWEMVKQATGETEPLDSVISSFHNEADDNERRQGYDYLNDILQFGP